MRIVINTRRIAANTYAVEADGMRLDTITTTADGAFASMDVSDPDMHNRTVGEARSAILSHLVY